MFDNVLITFISMVDYYLEFVF